MPVQGEVIAPAFKWPIVQGSVVRGGKQFSGNIVIDCYERIETQF